MDESSLKCHQPWFVFCESSGVQNSATPCCSLPPWHTVLSVTPLIKRRVGFPAVNTNRQCQWRLPAVGRECKQGCQYIKKESKIRGKQAFEDVLNELVKSVSLSFLMCVFVCWGFSGAGGKGGRRAWWQIHGWKWLRALLAPRLKRLIDCGSWLTLEKRQTSFPHFQLHPPELLFKKISFKDVKRETSTLTWEAREGSGWHLDSPAACHVPKPSVDLHGWRASRFWIDLLLLLWWMVKAVVECLAL